MSRLTLAAAALAVALAAPARAIDRFEVQVYEGDINAPWQPGLEVHANYTIRGTREPEYPGQVPPHHVGRLTLEPSLGVLEWLEVGAYLQFLAAPGGDQRFAGWKGRVKLVVPERLTGAFTLGVNVELAHVPSAIEPDRWGNEFRPIVAWKGGRWRAAVNPIFGWTLTGPDKLRPDLEPCGKLAFDTRLGFSVGAEYYTSLGLANDLLPVKEQEHLLLFAVDLESGEPPPGGKVVGAGDWEVNVAFGGALTDVPGPHLLVKAIVGRTF